MRLEDPYVSKAVDSVYELTVLDLPDDLYNTDGEA